MANLNFEQRLAEVSNRVKSLKEEAKIMLRRIQLDADMKKQTINDQLRRDISKAMTDKDKIVEEYRAYKHEQWLLQQQNEQKPTNNYTPTNNERREQQQTIVGYKQ